MHVIFITYRNQKIYQFMLYIHDTRDAKLEHVIQSHKFTWGLEKHTSPAETGYTVKPLVYAAPNSKT